MKLEKCPKCGGEATTTVLGEAGCRTCGLWAVTEHNWNSYCKRLEKNKNDPYVDDHYGYIS